VTLAPTSVRIVEGAARRFGEIDLIARLGHGGMAEVFLASRRAKPAELLVLKRLKADLDDPEHRAMFEDEARVMALLAHPNIVRTVDAGEEAGQKYLALEFLDGLPLDQCREAVTALGERAALHVAAELLEGLHYAHELRDREGGLLELVHRDVSPHNVFITYEGRVTLVDFGIAKSKNRGQHTATGVVRGKLSYMAPEQAFCDTLDRRADVFAAGVILWELLSGKRYWEGLSEVQILKRMTFGDLPKIRDAAPSIREPIAEALDQALAAKPEERFSTARAFREALADSFGGPFKRLVLGRAVNEAARGYREALQTVVDGHLIAARNTRGLPGIEPDEPAAKQIDARSVDAVRVGVSDGVSAAVDSQNAADEGDSIESGPSEDAGPSDDGGARRSRHRRGPAGYAGFETTGGSSLEVSSPAGGSGRRTALLVIAALGAIGVAAFVVPRLLVSDAPSNAAPVESARPSTLPPIEARIQIKLRATPSDAAVYLDSARVAELPLAAQFPRDQMSHALRVEAPGFKTKSQVLVFDHDMDLNIVLEPAEPTADPKQQPGASASTTSTPGALVRPSQPESASSPAKSVTPTTSGGFIKSDPWKVPGGTGSKKPK